MGSCVDEVVCVCVCDLITECMGSHCIRHRLEHARRSSVSGAGLVGCVCRVAGSQISTWLVGWSVLVCAFVCAFVSAFVCSFRGLFACVLSRE